MSDTRSRKASLIAGTVFFGGIAAFASIYVILIYQKWDDVLYVWQSAATIIGLQ